MNTSVPYFSCSRYEITTTSRRSFKLIILRKVLRIFPHEKHFDTSDNLFLGIKFIHVGDAIRSKYNNEECLKYTKIPIQSSGVEELTGLVPLPAGTAVG